MTMPVSVRLLPSEEQIAEGFYDFRSSAVFAQSMA
jgi:hypothetical protein